MSIPTSKVSPLYRSEWADEYDLTDSRSTFDESARQRTPRESPQLKSIESLKQDQVHHDPSTIDKTGCSLCSTWPRTFAFVAALILLCVTIVIVPIILTNTLGLDGQKSSTTSTTSFSVISTSTTTTTTTTKTTTTSDTTTTITTTTSTSTTSRGVCAIGCANTSTSTASRLALYRFENDVTDAAGSYSASTIGSPTYVTGYVNTAIYFDATLSQRAIAPAMSFNSRSFTIEFWFQTPNPIGNIYAFFGQLSSMNTVKQTLFLVIDNGWVNFGFFSDDTQGTKILAANTWYHLAFVYDYDLRQRLIYIDGLSEKQSAFGVGPYLGTSGPITMGGADIYGSYGIRYFTGALDHLTVSTRAKSACEILNDATLAVYLRFDGSYIDSGPNFLTVTSSNTAFTTGVANQGISLTGTSYVQISSLTGLGRVNYPFSIAFWVYPIVHGTLVHVSAASNGLGWCIPFIGIHANGSIMTQVQSATPSVIFGSKLQLNLWTHVVVTYSPTNGHKLYINGQLFAAMLSGTFYTASGVQNFITIGHRLSSAGACSNPGMLENPFQGTIDEFRVYSRELSSDDVCLLAWP